MRESLKRPTQVIRILKLLEDKNRLQYSEFFDLCETKRTSIAGTLSNLKRRGVVGHDNNTGEWYLTGKPYVLKNGMVHVIER